MALEFLFSPLLSLGPALGVFIFSIIILILINIFYKILVNQTVAKDIKARQKEISKRMQDERKKGDMNKMNELMKESLSENSRLMRMNMKPMIASFVIVIIFLPWLNITYGDHTVSLQNSTGVANLFGINHTVSVSGSEIAVEGGTMLGSDRKCDTTCFLIDNRSYEVEVQNNAVKFSPIVATFPFAFPIFGYTIGWLGWYILGSVPLVIMIRKFMKIYA
jgi:uncharacterized membrane protein (DUF106 family)